MLGYSVPSSDDVKYPLLGLYPVLMASDKNSRNNPPPSIPGSSRPWALIRVTRSLLRRSETIKHEHVSIINDTDVCSRA